MKLILILAGLLAGSIYALGRSEGAESVYLIQGKSAARTGTKIDLVKALLNEPGVRGFRCNEVELTENVTIKSKQKDESK